MAGIRERVDYLEKKFGLPLDECRRECDVVLRRVDGIGETSLPTPEEIESLIGQIERLSAMVSAVGSAGFSRRTPVSQCDPA